MGPAIFLLFEHRSNDRAISGGLLTTVCYQFRNAKPVYAAKVRSR